MTQERSVSNQIQQRSPTRYLRMSVALRVVLPHIAELVGDPLFREASN